MRDDINQPAVSFFKRQNTVIGSHMGRRYEQLSISSSLNQIENIRRDEELTMVSRTNCIEFHVTAPSRDLRNKSSFASPMLKIKLIPPKRVPFQERSSGEDNVDAAETDGRAKVVHVNITISKKRTVSTDCGTKAILVLHLFLHSDKGKVRLITLTAKKATLLALP